jgi:hypothetical protein
MATSEHDTTEPDQPVDLDRLIGELETEAARRRAEPSFPHDADARLHFELARQAPNPPQADTVGEMINQVREAAAFDDATTPEPAPTGSRRHDREALRGHMIRLDRRMASLGLAVIGALEAMATRFERLEERVRRLEPPPDEALSAPVPRQDGDALARWRSLLADGLARGERVLYAEGEADEIVAELRRAGVDAYGITSEAPRHRPGPDVRSGELLPHLRAVGDDALGSVVLAGGPEVVRAPDIGGLVAELGRVTRRVVVISEAPWWWRLRLGAVNADLAPARPLDPDTWLHAFHGVALVGTAQYDPTGQSYRVVVRAGP